MPSKKPSQDRADRIIERTWAEAQQTQMVKPTRTDSTILSVRMPRSTLQLLTQKAREQGKGPATLARELIEQGMALSSADEIGLAVRVLERLMAGTRAVDTTLAGRHREDFFTLRSYCSAVNDFRYHQVLDPFVAGTARQMSIGITMPFSSAIANVHRTHFTLSRVHPVGKQRRTMLWEHVSNASDTQPTARYLSDD